MLNPFKPKPSPQPAAPAETDEQKAERAKACLAEMTAVLEKHRCVIDYLQTYRNGTLAGTSLDVRVLP